MNSRPAITFSKFADPKKGIGIVLAAEEGGLGDAAKACDPGDILPRAFRGGGVQGQARAVPSM